MLGDIKMNRVKRILIGLGIFIIVVIVISFASLFISIIFSIIKSEFTPETKIPIKIEETIPSKETGEESKEIESLEKKTNLSKPTIKLEILQGPTKAGDFYFVRVKAIVTGNPAPLIEFSRDDSKGAWGENIAQVNLYPYAGYLLKATATNSEGSFSTNILLIVDDKGNLIKAEKNIKEDLIIEDLAYIKVLCSSYTDDADPEKDGISIDISFYNSRSEHISFYNIPIIINIKLFATEYNWDTLEEKIIEPPIYEGNVKIDHSMRLSEMFGEYIRIPFEDIGPLPDKEKPWGIAIVTVITPVQGKFETKEEVVILVPY